MADSAVQLTAVKGGIQRHRVKGGASQDSLYDMLNCYVTKEKTVKVRPGTFRAFNLPNETTLTDQGPTRGLVSFDSALTVFSADSDIQAEMPDNVNVKIINHPDIYDSNGDLIEIERIHFAKPFLGFLYVVAEFDNGDTYHFWLRTGQDWEAGKTYFIGDIVHPSDPNGFAYVAERNGNSHPAWSGQVPRAEGDFVEPTVYNGYYFEVTDTLGDNPHSGAVEPDWVAEDGAVTMEDADATPPPAAEAATTPNTGLQPDPATQARYRLTELAKRRLIQGV